MKNVTAVQKIIQTYIYISHTSTVIQQIQFHLMTNIDYKMFTADKPGGMDPKFSNFTLFIIQNTKKWQNIVEQFEKDSSMARDISEVAPEH